MKIGQVNNFYRPYYVLVNNKWYQVKKIKFYKDNEILVESQSGWLEKVDGDIKEVKLPIEKIKLKRKENFDGTVFIISRGKEWCGNDTMADLYIPADMLDIHFTRHEIAYKTQVRAIFEGEQGIYISHCVKLLDSKLHIIRGQYEEVYKKVSDSCLAVCQSEQVLDDIDKLKELAEKFIAERKRVHNLTIDDIEI
jgi:hypothetical protein